MTCEFETEARIDHWNDGALDGCRNQPKRSNDADYLEGYAHGQRDRQIRVVMPARPEGYYHMPLGAFE